MEVNDSNAPVASPAPSKPVLLNEYWPRYRRSARLVTGTMQLAVAVVVASSLLVGGVSVQDPAFIITLIATLLCSSMLNMMLIDLLLTPHRDIVRAIAHAAGEEPDGPLASPNSVRSIRSGFKPVLQFVYELAANSGVSADLQQDKSASNDQLRQLSIALDQAAAGIIVMDASGAIQYANRHAPIGKTPDEVPYLDLLFEKDGEFDAWLADCRANAVRAEKSWLRVPNKVVGVDDRRIFDVTVNYEKGSAAEVVIVCFDSSNRYQPEDDELDFIAFAAHELRGPITVIRGYLDVLSIEAKSDLAPEQQELITRLIVSANRLSGYINNILNASKFDRRHLRVHLVEESLASIYDSIRDDMELRAASQNRLLSVSIPPTLPTIAADRSSLSEVISNLIDNALKYSNEGGSVIVSASQKDNYITVSVQDFGIGMPSNVVGNLFHKFYRSHRSRETVAGTGIGLYICKAIVESHGGHMGVTSVEGKGSTFSFTIPTYASVADKLLANDHTNAGLIRSSDGWIKNHAKYTG